MYGWYRRFDGPYVEIASFQMMDPGEIVHPRTVLTYAAMEILVLLLLTGAPFLMLN